MSARGRDGRRLRSARSDDRTTDGTLTVIVIIVHNWGPWETRRMAIIGVHAILHTNDAAADRAFFADVLGLASVDAGEGWLIFALPPAELATHPASADGGGYDLYLMCDDIEATVRELTAQGVEFGDGVTEQRWGLITTMRLPGGGRLGLYEPRHASPLLPAG
jgi:catechol 2,3-dioxygenase-like lactoylglutathione lyase family enzyme